MNFRAALLVFAALFHGTRRRVRQAGGEAFGVRSMGRCEHGRSRRDALPRPGRDARRRA